MLQRLAQPRFKGRRPGGLVLAVALAILVSSAALAASPLTRVTTRPGPSLWVATDGARLLSGGAGETRLAPSPFGPDASWSVAGEAAVDGALFGIHLFLARGDAPLQRVDLADAAPRAVDLELAGITLLAAMDDHLLAFQPGHGLHVLHVVPGHAHGHHAPAGDSAPRLEPVGFLPLAAPVTALTASARRATVATPGELLWIDLGEPARPRIARRLPLAGKVDALAASGPRVHLLQAAGLHVLDLSDEWPVEQLLDPAITGTGLAVAGRIIHVATPSGLMTYHDSSAQMQTFFVSVGNNFFAPQEITVEVGDTVRWSNLSIGGIHNVESCVPGQSGCFGETSSETFGNGPAIGPPWIYLYTFTQPGENPYVCIPHAPDMRGLVSVNVPTPPAVSSGSAGQPMTAAPLANNGSILWVWWDTGTCAGGPESNLIYGFGSQLPSVAGGAFQILGSRCGITSSPYTWTGVPDPGQDPSGILWWLMVTSDGAGTEGAWGLDSAGAERRGPAPDGNSGECGVTAKDASNTCGQ